MATHLILCGCGTVGLHVLKLFEKLQPPIIVDAVFVKNPAKARLGLQKDYNFTCDLDEVLRSEADVVVEVMGGTEEAAAIVETALRNGRRVVTANKALLFQNILDSPKQRGGLSLLDEFGESLMYEAAVAGGIPIIRTLRSAYFLSVRQIRGVLNGTCNFILDHMARHKCTYGEALQLAKERGYAEADPWLDVEGIDAYQKLNILSHMVFGAAPGDSLRPQGISNIEPVDILYALDMGCVIRHVCSVESAGENGLRICCLPAILRGDDDLVVAGPMNVVQIDGGMPVVLKGEGAGGIPTANSVYADVIEAIGKIRSPLPKPSSTTAKKDLTHTEPVAFYPPQGQFFIRFTVTDQCGIIADVGEECRRLDINIHSILQHPESGPLCNFVVVTECAGLESVQTLVENLRKNNHWFISSFLALMLRSSTGSRP